MKKFPKKKMMNKLTNKFVKKNDNIIQIFFLFIFKIKDKKLSSWA